jgi:FkbH-like protein
MEPSSLRAEIQSLLDRGQWLRAARQLTLLWECDATPASAGYVASSFEKLRNKVDLAPHRCAILRSFTVEPLVPLLKASAFAAGIDLTLHIGDFNTYAQDLLDDDGPLYRFQPDTVILAVQTRDIAPELWAGSLEHAAEHTVEKFAGWIQAFRLRSHANLIVHSLESPVAPAQGIYNSQLALNQADAIHEVNRQLRQIAGRHRGVYILDYDALVARRGREYWSDERKWLTVRLPIAAPNLIFMAREWTRYLAPLAGKIAKAVALDLDNTLWGGVIGEDGISGIQLGPEYPGAAYSELQRVLHNLTRRGILLAACSKNNPDDALEALKTHPGMLLHPEHFACLRINWNEKSRNLREIAAELDIGLDSIAFLDDNPVERQQVREQAPEVIVPELPKDPMTWARLVETFPAFERLAVSEEDRRRTTYYAAERQRAELEQTAASREDFFRSLDQRAEIAPVDSFTLARVSQLTQKTNQFNLTTRRYTEQQIAEMAARPGWQVLSIKVMDRYADNGIVGVAITRNQGTVCEIDTFLLSCRVIGRTVETALLAHLADEARSRGAQRLEGWFLPTKKNAPAKNFYRENGFRLLSETEAGQLWGLDLANAMLRCPEWVQLNRAVAENA